MGRLLCYWHCWCKCSGRYLARQMWLFRINQSEKGSKITTNAHTTSSQLHQRSITSAAQYKYKTYLLTLLEPLCRYPVVSHFFVLSCMLQQGDNAVPSQSAVCNYAVSLLQTLILQHPDPGLPLRIQMPAWQVLCFNLQNAWYHSSKNYIKGSL